MLDTAAGSSTSSRAATPTICHAWPWGSQRGSNIVSRAAGRRRPPPPTRRGRSSIQVPYVATASCIYKMRAHCKCAQTIMQFSRAACAARPEAGVDRRHAPASRLRAFTELGQADGAALVEDRIRIGHSASLAHIYILARVARHEARPEPRLGRTGHGRQSHRSSSGAHWCQHDVLPTARNHTYHRHRRSLGIPWHACR